MGTKATHATNKNKTIQSSTTRIRSCIPRTTLGKIVYGGVFFCSLFGKVEAGPIAGAACVAACCAALGAVEGPLCVIHCSALPVCIAAFAAPSP